MRKNWAEDDDEVTTDNVALKAYHSARHYLASIGEALPNNVDDALMMEQISLVLDG